MSKTKNVKCLVCHKPVNLRHRKVTFETQNKAFFVHLHEDCFKLAFSEGMVDMSVPPYSEVLPIDPPPPPPPPPDLQGRHYTIPVGNPNPYEADPQLIMDD